MTGRPPRPLRLLLVEDSADDAALVVRALQRAGYAPAMERVEDAQGLSHALASATWDALICDYSLPCFGAPAALRLVAQAGVDLPIIVVSGEVGEQKAVEVMKAGAHDFVLKKELARLAPALGRELAEVEIRRRARAHQAALRESEARFHALARVSPVGIFQTDAEGSCIYVNERWCAIAGLSADEARGAGWTKCIHPDDRARVAEEWHESVRRGRPFDLDWRLRRGNEVVWVSGQAAPDHDEAGRLRSYVGTIADVTRSRRILDELQASEHRLNEAERIGRLGNWELDHARGTTIWSDEIYRIFERNPATPPLDYQGFLDCVHPEDRDRVHELYRASVKARAPYDIEHRLALPDGRVKYVHERGRTEYTAAGRPLFTLGTVQDITERRMAELRVEASERRFRTLFDASVAGIFGVDASGTVVSANPALARMLGYGSVEEMRDVRHVAKDVYVDPADRARFRERMQAEALVEDFVTQWRRHDGSVITVSISARRVGDGEFDYIGMVQDITERRLAAQRIERLNRVHAVLSGINGLIVRARERQQILEGACRIGVEQGGFISTGIARYDAGAEALVAAAVAGVAAFGPSISTAKDSPHRDITAVRAVRERRTVVDNDLLARPDIGITRRRNIDAGARSIISLPLFRGEALFGVLVVYAAAKNFFDADEVRLLEELAGDISFALDYLDKAERASFLAYYDPLTSLANRKLFLQRLAQTVSDAGRVKACAGVALVNVERFKRVNDSLGRQAGDALLKEVGQRLCAAAGEQSRVARVGADHFAVILSAARQGEDLAGRLDKARAGVDGRPYRIHGSELRISTRAGVALFPQDGGDAETLFRNAEAALKQSRSGQGFVFYSPEMTERVAEKLALETRLRQALEKEEFVLHYQPKVDLSTGAVVGAEALIRWASPERGLVPPASFIPLLEETGLIVQAGAWAMAHAAREHARWRAAGLNPPRVAVNVSAVQLLRPDFVESVRTALATAEGPSGIDLEITESLIMEEVEKNIAKLASLRELGVGVAIDDFGTGYSSLGYLAKLPVQALKIDRSFIVRMATDADAMALVSTIVSLARTLRLGVVAEGVDDPVQAELLLGMGCRLAQGYLFSRPLPPLEFERLLASGATLRPAQPAPPLRPALAFNGL